MRTLNPHRLGISGSACRTAKTILLLTVIVLGLAAVPYVGLVVAPQPALADDLMPGDDDPPLPIISEFTGENVYEDLWDFCGTVTGGSPVEGLTVTFGGLVSGTVTTAIDGTFLLNVAIPEGSNGWVTAEVTSAQGQTSETVMWLVQT